MGDTEAQQGGYMKWELVWGSTASVSPLNAAKLEFNWSEPPAAGESDSATATASASNPRLSTLLSQPAAIPHSLITKCWKDLLGVFQGFKTKNAFVGKQIFEFHITSGVVDSW